MIVTGGRIFLGLHDGFAEALAICGDRVVSVGSAADIPALRSPDTRVIDLVGRLAVPGLNDAHMHLIPLVWTGAWLRPRSAH